ncbi:MAG: cysteine desulfurase family protein [bacterium]
MPASVYLDYAASNPVDPRVGEAVAVALGQVGNPSSVHSFGRAAVESLDRARSSVAGLLSVDPGEVFFTSGATEANALALRGFFGHLRTVYGPETELRLAVSSLEHASVRSVVSELETEYGVLVDRLPVDADGVVEFGRVGDALRPSTVMVCVMWANNVIGSLQPVREIGKAVADERLRRGASGLPIAFMSDAVQAMRTEDVRPKEVGIDLLTLSGHKIYAPKGTGAIYVRRGIELRPLVSGGGQEGGLRGGTENLPGIVGLGQAAELLADRRAVDRALVVGLTSRLRSALREVPGLTVYGDREKSVPGILFFSTESLSGDELALRLDLEGLAVSTGSACEAGHRRTSPVIESICSGRAMRHGGVRVSVGRFSVEDDIDRLADAVGRLLAVR